MSVCDYCGQKAGWFQNNHPACITKATDTARVVEKIVLDGTLTGRDYEQLYTELQKVLSDNGVAFKYVRDSALQGANDAASEIALKSPVSKPEFERLVGIIRGLDGSQNDYLSDEYTSQMLNRRWFAMGQLQMSYVLWQVLHNITPDFDETGDRVAFNLRGGEVPIFQTGNCVTYAEERTVTNRSRSYQGLSIPVGGGIYYHIGGSQGHQERTSGLLPLDGGSVLITTKSLYFGGQNTTLRIPLDHVLRYQPYVDGVGVCESHGAPKVFVFDYRGMDAGWFFYNLLAALSRQQVGTKTGAGPEPNQPVLDLQTAFDAFEVANDTFTDVFKNAIANKGTMTNEDLETYTTKVDTFFAAARHLEGRFQFASRMARDKYHEAFQNMEASWARFASLDNGQMNGDAFIPFLNDVAAFMKARNDYVLG